MDCSTSIFGQTVYKAIFSILHREVWIPTIPDYIILLIIRSYAFRFYFLPGRTQKERWYEFNIICTYLFNNIPKQKHKIAEKDLYRIYF